MSKRFMITVILMGFCLTGLPTFSIATEPYTIDMAPGLIAIDAGYNGAQLRVKGEIPNDSDVLIEVKGDGNDTELLKKGHVLGLLWMNTGTVTFHGLPKVYMLYLPESITVSELNLDPQLQQLKAGFVSLERETAITPENENKEVLFQELFKLKTAEKLYTQQEKAITYQNINDDMKSFTCEIQIPATIKPGTYTVTTSLLKNKTVFHSDNRQLKVIETGFPAMISGLAFQHGAIYGILATLIAVIAGLLMGFAFKGGKGGH